MFNPTLNRQEQASVPPFSAAFFSSTVKKRLYRPLFSFIPSYKPLKRDLSLLTGGEA